MGIEQVNGMSAMNSELQTFLRTSSQHGGKEEERLEWLRSQLIGGNMEFETPLGKRLLTYADHMASGRCLHYIEDYIVQQILPYYGNTHTSDSFVGSKTTRTVHDATDYIKRSMGAGEDDAIIFCGSGATAGMKRLQEILGISVSPILRDKVLNNLRDEERWVVFIGPYEHHSNLLSWRQSLAEVVEIGITDEGLIDIEELKYGLESMKYANRPMLGSFSACSNVTGILSDTREIARVLHQHGAFACFDIAACAPYIQIDMRSGDIEGYDAVFISPHKFLGGPGTPGILLMNKSLYLLKQYPPSTCGGGTVCYVNGFNESDTLYHDDIEEREDGGTPQIIQKIRVALAFWVKEYVGHELIDHKERFYFEAALKRLLPNPKIQVLGNSKAEKLAIFSFLVFPDEKSSVKLDYESCNLTKEKWMMKGKPLNGRFVAILLNDLFGVQARGGCACAGPYGHFLLGIDEELSLRLRSLVAKGYSGLKPGWTRVSFPYYMSKVEFTFILECLEFVAAFGHRFIPLYQFDWVTGSWTFNKRAFKYHFMKEELNFATNEISSRGMKRREREGINQKGAKITNEQVNKFTSYLENARRIAHSLPDYYKPANIPDDIDPSMVLFKF